MRQTININLEKMSYCYALGENSVEPGVLSQRQEGHGRKQTPGTDAWEQVAADLAGRASLAGPTHSPAPPARGILNN